MGFVYLLREDESDFYKIGRATDPDRRLRDLKTGNFRPIHLVKIISCAYPSRIENQLHKKYSHYRIQKTEWFQFPEAAVLDLVDTLNRLDELDSKATKPLAA